MGVHTLPCGKRPAPVWSNRLWRLALDNERLPETLAGLHFVVSP